MSCLCTLLLAGAVAADGPPPAERPTVMTMAYPVTDLTAGNAAALGALADELVAETGRENWATFGGPGTVRVHDATGALVVRQTRANHERIAVFLTAERAASTQLETGLWVIELPAGRTAADWGAVPGLGAAADGADAFVLPETVGHKFAETATNRLGGRLLSNPRLIVLSGREATVQGGEVAGFAAGLSPAVEKLGETKIAYSVRFRCVPTRTPPGGVSMTLTAASGGEATAPAGPGAVVPAGGTFVRIHTDPDGRTLLVVASPAAVE